MLEHSIVIFNGNTSTTVKISSIHVHNPSSNCWKFFNCMAVIANLALFLVWHDFRISSCAFLILYLTGRQVLYYEKISLSNQNLFHMSNIGLFLNPV